MCDFASTNLNFHLTEFCVPQTKIASTPLITACENNHLEVAHYLIRKGANINYVTKVVNCFFCFQLLYFRLSPQFGFSSLHFASFKGHRAMVQLLIESQAKLDMKDNVNIELLVACMSMGS